jgi:hypothetical protein
LLLILGFSPWVVLRPVKEPRALFTTIVVTDVMSFEMAPIGGYV